MPEPIREAVAARPRGPLAGLVAEHHGYRERHVPPALHRGLPSPWLTLIFTLDEPLDVARHPDPAQRADSYETLVGGLHTSPAHVVHRGAQSGVQLQLDPLGARSLLGVPAGELAALDLPATDLLGRLGVEAHERLRAAPDWPARFRALDEVLGRRAAAPASVAPELREAWRLLRTSGGTARVAALAAAVGWSERHLTRRFRAEIGLSPKQAGRVIRFDRARRLLPTRPAAEVAAVCGYADQPHLVRDVREFTGLSPRAWLAAEVRNVQDWVAPDRVDWAS